MSVLALSYAQSLPGLYLTKGPHNLALGPLIDRPFSLQSGNIDPNQAWGFVGYIP